MDLPCSIRVRSEPASPPFSMLNESYHLDCGRARRSRADEHVEGLMTSSRQATEAKGGVPLEDRVRLTRFFKVRCIDKSRQFGYTSDRLRWERCFDPTTIPSDSLRLGKAGA